MNPRFELLEWTIDPFANRFVRADGAAPVRVEPKVMQVLVLLAERPGETVTKEEFFERVWEGRCLTDDVLTVAVSALRKALGDAARSPRFVQTVPGQGYRLVAPVVHADEGRRVGPATRARLALAGIAAAVLLAAFFARSANDARAESIAPALEERRLEAEYLLRRREPVAAERALVLLDELVADAPAFAAARVSLAEAHLLAAEMGSAPDAALGAARGCASAALELGESSAARAILAQVRFALDWDFAGAEADFRAALDLDPSNARAHLGLSAVLVARGRGGEALAHVSEYTRLDPHAYPSPFRALLLARLGRFGEASAELERLAANAPEQPDLLIFLARVHAAAGDTLGAFEAYDAYYERTGVAGEVRGEFRERVRADGLRGMHLFILARLEARRARGVRVSPVELAACHAFAGNADEAFAWLGRAFDERALALPFIAGRPAFLGLSADPRFAGMFARMARS